MCLFKFLFGKKKENCENNVKDKFEEIDDLEFDEIMDILDEDDSFE